MSDASERPERDPSAEVPPAAEEAPADPDAWADACAEDLAAEEARRRARYGPPPGSAAEEFGRLAEADGDTRLEFSRPLLGAASFGVVEGVTREFTRQARQRIEPVVRSNPGVFDHLAAAGGELLAAYRSAVGEAERGHTRRAAEPPPKAGPFDAEKAAEPAPDEHDAPRGSAAQPGAAREPNAPGAPEDNPSQHGLGEGPQQGTA